MDGALKVYSFGGMIPTKGSIPSNSTTISIGFFPESLILMMELYSKKSSDFGWWYLAVRIHFSSYITFALFIIFKKPNNWLYRTGYHYFCNVIRQNTRLRVAKQIHWVLMITPMIKKENIVKIWSFTTACYLSQHEMILSKFCRQFGVWDLYETTTDDAMSFLSWKRKWFSCR